MTLHRPRDVAPSGAPSSGELTARLGTSLLIWAFIGVLIAQQSYAMRGGASSGVAWWRFVAYSVLGASVWGLATPGIAWLVRRVPLRRGHWLSAVVSHLIACTVINWVDAVVNTRFAFLVGRPAPGVWPTLIELYLWGLSCYIGVAAIVHALELNRTLREQAQRATMLAEQLATARLRALQSQIHPHFLFNTLNSLAEQIWEDREKADRMVLLLGAMLRTTLGLSQRTLIPVREEIAALHDYLDLVTLRHQGRLHTRISVNPAVEAIEVPSLLLQPLVENAVQHGMEGSAEPTTIEIEAAARDGMLELVVMDDGAGLPTGRVERFGIGLSNTRERLRELYGDAASLTVSPRHPRGVAARVILPIAAARADSSARGRRASQQEAVDPLPVP